MSMPPATCVAVRNAAGALVVTDRDAVELWLVVDHDPRAVAALLADVDRIAASDRVPLLADHGDGARGHVFSVEPLKPAGEA